MRSSFVWFKFAEQFRWFCLVESESTLKTFWVLSVACMFCGFWCFSVCLFVFFPVKTSYFMFMPIIRCGIRRSWGGQKCKFFWTSSVSRKALARLRCGSMGLCQNFCYHVFVLAIPGFQSLCLPSVFKIMCNLTASKLFRSVYLWLC